MLVHCSKGVVVTTSAYNEFLSMEICDAVKHLEDVAYGNEAGNLKRNLQIIFVAVKKNAGPLNSVTQPLNTKRRNGQVLNSPMAVVIQDMVDCKVSGVLFTCDPITHNPSVITVTANYGLGETIVSGSVEPDTFILRRKENGELEVQETFMGNKHQKIIMQESGGTVTEDVEDNLRNEYCLKIQSVERLGKIAFEIEKYYTSSRDIEWGISDDNIYILQCRPVTKIAAETDHEIKHEFDAPLRCENEYFTVANIGEILPEADVEKGFPDHLFKCKYFPDWFSALLQSHDDDSCTDDNKIRY
ncbi:uncharacterized phosphotransferase YvkC [Caerostris extrusa]|uniref:Uncharacterized phosphotransferase YvkC n=1 Tax=Caerostris extrusa TaxID=172846 RepID=A0AAV4SBB2_CAEEX|nr:uncharacterized phosphotransferase YvkC [Caerostris extrusa]